MPHLRPPRQASFAARLVAWHKRHGRRGLPWQGTRDPYRIWLSEVMLQQTQVSAVIPYYERFLQRFPTVEALARASEDAVLRLWSGLGYYARGRNLHAAAKQIAEQGRFPGTAEAIGRLPGVGRTTAAAIAAFAFGERAAILDGNVKRVIARSFGVAGWPGKPAVQQRLWAIAETLLPKRDIGTYTQALMDLGATLCTRARPGCGKCPVSASCVAYKQDLVDVLPTPRPRQPLPERQATWLILRQAGRILLERRPASGLWGGLWSFPECDHREPRVFCREVLNYDVEAMRDLAPVQHGFTHFQLRIRPVVCDVRRAAHRAELPGRLWLDLPDALEAAIPAPVRKVLNSVQ
jgi:A/G-specific adenine glycosylase